jgi:hypothetical protein
VQLPRDESEVAKDAALGALPNFCQDVDSRKSIAATLRTIQLMVQLLRDGTNTAKVQEAAAILVQSLAFDSVDVWFEIVAAGAIHQLVVLLSDSTCAGSVKVAAARALRGLAEMRRAERSWQYLGLSLFSCSCESVTKMRRHRSLPP